MLDPTRGRRAHGRRRAASWTDIVGRNEVVYGVTTGFGKLSDVAIPPDKLAALQVNLVRSHAAGVGAPLPRREVRAMMLLRANVLAKGFSGARADAAGTALRDARTPDLWPPVPEQGSVGASGDLAPLAHLALALIGEGELCRGGGSRRRRGGCSRAAGLAPLVARAQGRARADQRHAGAHGGRRARGRRRAHALAHGARRGRRVARGAARHAGRVRRAHPRRARPGRAGGVGGAACARCSRTAPSASRTARTIRACRTRTRCAACRRCTGPCSTRSRSPRASSARELNAATDNPLVFDDGTMLSRRQLPRAGRRDGARLPRDRR